MPVRLFRRGEKVTMKKGDVQVCDAEKALMLAKRYHGKFDILEGHELTDKEMKSVKKRISASEKTLENVEKAAREDRELVELRGQARAHLKTLHDGNLLSEDDYSSLSEQVNEAETDELSEILTLEGESQEVKVGDDDEVDCPNCVLGKTEEAHVGCPEADKLNKEVEKAAKDAKKAK